MKKRILAMLMAGAMVTGMLAGCGGGSDGAATDGSSASADGSTGTEGSSEEVDMSPITFEYYNADGKNGNWSETAVGAAITEATGVTLEITYPVSSTGDASEDDLFKSSRNKLV